MRGKGVYFCLCVYVFMCVFMCLCVCVCVCVCVYVGLCVRVFVGAKAVPHFRSKLTFLVFGKHIFKLFYGTILVSSSNGSHSIYFITSILQFACNHSVHIGGLHG